MKTDLDTPQPDRFGERAMMFYIGFFLVVMLPFAFLGDPSCPRETMTVDFATGEVTTQCVGGDPNAPAQERSTLFYTVPVLVLAAAAAGVVYLATRPVGTPAPAPAPRYARQPRPEPRPVAQPATRQIFGMTVSPFWHALLMAAAAAYTLLVCALMALFILSVFRDML